MNASAPIFQSHLRVISDLQTLAQVLQWFEQFDRQPLNRELWMQSQLALTEGFTNAVRHAHQGLPTQTPIKIEGILLGDRLEIRIWDQGKPFDLETSLNTLGQQQTHPLLRQGNWGSVILRKLKYDLDWTIEYQLLSDSQNCLFLCKSLGS